jgi:PAS domain S-box-containing protein
MRKPIEKPVGVRPLVDAVRSGLPTYSRAAVIATTGEGTIVFWNAHAERLLGWSTGEVIGREILDLGPPHVRDRTAVLMAALQSRASPLSGETVIWRGGRIPVAAYTILLPLGDITHGRGAIVGVSVPLRQRNRIARDVQRLYAHLRRRLGLPQQPVRKSARRRLIARPPSQRVISGAQGLYERALETRRLEASLRRRGVTTGDWKHMQRIELYRHRCERVSGGRPFSTPQAKRLGLMWATLARFEAARWRGTHPSAPRRLRDHPGRRS